jgi:polar amino acid transport system substrate-binding protein
MKKLLLVLMIFGLFFAYCAKKPETPEGTRTTLKVGTDATYPPFETVNTSTGKPEGFDIDLMTAICNIHGWETEFIVTPFDGMIPGLIAYKYDAAISAITITPQRAAVVDFSEPYYTAGQTIAVPLNDTTIHSVADLRGKRVGVQLGTTGEIMAKRMDGVQVFSYDNIGAAFIDMQNGNLDAVLNDYPTTREYIKQHGTTKTVGPILSKEHYGIAVRTSETALLKDINSALDSIRANGTYDSLHMKWFGVLPQKEVVDSTDTTGDTLPK